MVGRQPLPAAASHGCVHALSAEVGKTDWYSCKGVLWQGFPKKVIPVCVALQLCTAPCRAGQGQRVVHSPEHLLFPLAAIYRYPEDLTSLDAAIFSCFPLPQSLCNFHFDFFSVSSSFSSFTSYFPFWRCQMICDKLTVCAGAVRRRGPF